MADLYESEGPCCAEYRAARRSVETRIKVLHALGANTPRHAVMFFQNMSEESRAVVAVGAGDRCPCHEAPNPRAFREFLARTKFSGVDPLGERGLEVAAEVVRKYEMDT